MVVRWYLRISISEREPGRKRRGLRPLPLLARSRRRADAVRAGTSRIAGAVGRRRGVLLRALRLERRCDGPPTVPVPEARGRAMLGRVPARAAREGGRRGARRWSAGGPKGCCFGIGPGILVMIH